MNPAAFVYTVLRAREIANWMHEFVNTEISQRCSTFLDAMVESLQEYSNDTEADATFMLEVLLYLG